MRCDTSGAGYAIFWANVDGKLVVAGDYVTDARKEELKSKNLPKSFAEESESIQLDANGDGYECSNRIALAIDKPPSDSLGEGGGRRGLGEGEEKKARGCCARRIALAILIEACAARVSASQPWEASQLQPNF
jgi:hypothetical protein